MAAVVSVVDLRGGEIANSRCGSCPTAASYHNRATLHDRCFMAWTNGSWHDHRTFMYRRWPSRGATPVRRKGQAWTLSHLAAISSLCARTVNRRATPEVCWSWPHLLGGPPLKAIIDPRRQLPIGGAAAQAAICRHWRLWPDGSGELGADVPHWCRCGVLGAAARGKLPR